MALYFFNTFSKRKDLFKPIKDGKVGLYSCGPTVYNYAHIGNFRSYVFVDILKRYLAYKGFGVDHVMNITDIDDKTIRDSAKEGMELNAFAKKYTDAFMHDLKMLNIQPASHYPRATEYVDDMIEFVEKLEEKGFAYEKLGSVYFDISKYEGYGRLSKVDLTQMKAGARVDLDEYEKDHPGDFTLMKRSKLDELKRGIYYDTKWGKCRPGWHLECSVMSMKILGETFDIHTGGIDLTFPHHENEIAQSVAYSGKPFVNYWLHCEHLIVDGKKMSKSAGNFYTLRDVLSKGHDPAAVRYLLLRTHYRQQLNFTFQGVEDSKKAVDKLNNLIFNLRNARDYEDDGEMDDVIRAAREWFEKNMDDDLNISEALGAVFEFARKANSLIDDKKISRESASRALSFLGAVDSVLGVMDLSSDDVPEEITALAAKREEARSNMDWKEADRIRDEISSKGYVIEDGREGVKIKKA